MIERSLVEAEHLKGNKGVLKQFAIEQARNILKAAGVVDPAIKDQTLAPEAKRTVEPSFYVIPESEVMTRSTLVIGGASKEQLEAEVKAMSNVSDYYLDMLHNPKVTTLEEPTTIELAKLRIGAFGLPGNPTNTQLIDRITHSRIGDMAVELSPFEVGPHQRKADKDQPMDDWYVVMHEPVADRGGRPSVSILARDYRGLWLSAHWAFPDNHWRPESLLLVALRKIEPVKA